MALFLYGRISDFFKFYERMWGLPLAFFLYMRISDFLHGRMWAPLLVAWRMWGLLLLESLLLHGRISEFS